MKTNNIGSIQIRRERLSVQVADEIQRIIMDGELKPGEKLPSERELSEQLGVSRTVIREAIKAMEERGLVKVITGSGSYISKVDPEVVIQSIDLYVRGRAHAFRDLIEIRKSLEVEIAGLAAERATEEEIDEIEEAFEEMKEFFPMLQDSVDSMERFVQADMKFHQILAKASHNSLFPILLLPITELLFDFSRQASLVPGAPEIAIHSHQTIIDSIRSRDGTKCREAMSNHLSKGEQLLDIMQKVENIQG